jgi:hypothetical protein
VSFLSAAPELMSAAALDLQGVGSALSEAHAAAAGATTRVAAAAADEVSTAIASLFSAHAEEFQALGAQAAAFHDQFVRALSASAGSYAGAEGANATLLLEQLQQDVLTAVNAPTQALLGRPLIGTGGASSEVGAAAGVTAAPAPLLIASRGTVLVVGSTGTSRPGFRFMSQVYDLFAASRFPGYSLFSVFTPAQIRPFIGTLGWDESVAGGAANLHAAIMNQYAAGNNMVVLGFSQGSTVASMEMRYLETLPPSLRPAADELSFVLLGNPSNPNGGILARLPEVFLEPLGLTFSGGTPNSIYSTTVYTIQYDGWADFPRYPLNAVATLNAVLGIHYAHSDYEGLTPAQVATGVVQPVSPGNTNSTYILIPNENLPLLEAMRDIGVPQPVLDLIEPDLRVIIELGYDRAGYADVPSPVGLFPTHLDPVSVAHDLAQGTVQGVNAALASQGLAPLPTLPDLPNIPDLPNLPFLSDLSNTLPTPPGLSQIVPATVHVPPEIAAAIDGPLDHFEASLNTAINDQLHPAITSGIVSASDSLSAALASQGASPQVTNAIHMGGQLLPLLVEGPTMFLMADVHYLVNAIEDLAAGSLGGFIQNLQLIPASNLTLIVLALSFGAVAVPAIVAGNAFPV